jgi:hypothetical protein
VEVVASFKAEGYIKMPDLPGDLGLTAQFISIASPGQAIISGTSSFRVDRIAAHLSSDGARRYLERGLNAAYSPEAARRFADAILEEVLGVYQPPDVRWQSYKQYLAAAFAVPENRARADSVYRSLLEEIGKLWGTLMGVKGYTRGESFVARNVGLRNVWEDGQWKVKIIFMDHDSLVIPSFTEKDFWPTDALPNTALDETYIWGTQGAHGSILGAIGHLRKIYRVSDEIHEQARVRARIAVKKAYEKTRHELSSNPKFRALFDPVFIERLPDWNKLVRGYLRQNSNSGAIPRWKEKTREMLAKKDYDESEINDYLEGIDTNRSLLERLSFLFSR